MPNDEAPVVYTGPTDEQVDIFRDNMEWYHEHYRDTGGCK